LHLSVPCSNVDYCHPKNFRFVHWRRLGKPRHRQPQPDIVTHGDFAYRRIELETLIAVAAAAPEHDIRAIVTELLYQVDTICSDAILDIQTQFL
jgi:hypothetical protein